MLPFDVLFDFRKGNEYIKPQQNFTSNNLFWECGVFFSPGTVHLVVVAFTEIKYK